MHPFVCAIVLWATGPRSMHFDTELQPIHRQARKASWTHASEGRAIVAVDGARQSILFEESVHRLAHLFASRTQHCMTAQQISARAVHQRQRIAPQMIAR